MVTDFRPLPYLGNPHLQTLLGNLLAGKPIAHPTRIRPVPLTDGDALLTYDSVPDGWTPGQPMAVMAHGLGGSHRSGHLQRVGRRLLDHGVRVVRLDLRGCGDGIHLARRPYHGGSSEDVRAAVEALQTDPVSPVSLIGFSLGGNIVLKLAGEAVDRPLPGLQRVAAVGPPIHLGKCAALLGERRNQFYERYFLSRLIQQVRRRQACFPDQPAVRFPGRMNIRRFDELYTAPQCGFADAVDYYTKSSSLPLLPRIQVPALLLTARDDPFVAVEPFEEVMGCPNLHVRILEGGGHLGFIGWDGAGGIRWAENRVVRWVVRGE